MTEKLDLTLPMGAQQIRAILPHRYPFLLVDRVTELEPGVSAVGMKLVSHNEPWTQGHFPGEPVMPGVLQIEAVAQLGGIMLLSQPEFFGKRVVLAGIERTRFRRIVRPGDTLDMAMQLDSMRMGVGKASGSASVGGEIALVTTIKFGFVD